MTSLEFYTSAELVNELMKRKTFMGIIIHSKEEFKERTWQGDKAFHVHVTANLDAGETSLILGAVAGSFDLKDRS
jgi:hypothetical protein